MRMLIKKTIQSDLRPFDNISKTDQSINRPDLKVSPLTKSATKKCKYQMIINNNPLFRLIQSNLNKKMTTFDNSGCKQNSKVRNMQKRYEPMNYDSKIRIENKLSRLNSDNLKLSLKRRYHKKKKSKSEHLCNPKIQILKLKTLNNKFSNTD